MFKTATVAITSSLATAMLLGLTFAGPRQATPAGRSIGIKLEWIKESPKLVESLTLSVDNGKEGTISRPTANGAGTRQVVVLPTLNEDGTITLKLHVRSVGGPTESLDTVITVENGATKVISAAITKGDAKQVKSPTQELVFVTPTLE